MTLMTLNAGLVESSLAGGEVGNPFKGSVEEFSLALNSDPRFDRLKKAAAGDQSIAREVMRGYISEYCGGTHKCVGWNNTDLELKSEVAVKFAKIQLKAFEVANKKYAETLVKLNGLLNECQEKPTGLFTQEFKESCYEEIVCKGSKAKELNNMFEDINDFNYGRVGLNGVQLSEEEKIISGKDISFMLNKHQENKNVFINSLNAVYPQFSIVPYLGRSISKKDKSNLFSSKSDSTITERIYFDKSDIPEGVMTLRALECVSQKSAEYDKDKFDCHVFVGNTDVSINALNLKKKERKNCLVPEKNDFFASFKNFFNKEKDSVEINDSDRGKVKAVETETSGVQQKSTKNSER